MIFIGGVRSNSEFFLDHQEKFFYDVFFPYIEKEGIDTVWCLGDFFENRRQVSVKILNHAHKFLKEFDNRKIKLYMILGNHDVYYRNTNEVSSIPPIIEQYECVHLIKHPYEVIDFGGNPVAFTNWISHEDKENVMDFIKTVDTNILCGHYEISGFEIVHGVPCKSGWFTANDFDRFDRVLSGHFHIRSTNGLINYVGNPYQTNWGEAADEKGFHIFDVAKNDLQFIKNPVSVYEIMYFDDNFDIPNFDARSLKDKIVRLNVRAGTDRRRVNLILDKISPFVHSSEVVEENAQTIDQEELDKIVDTHQYIHQFIEHCNIDHLDSDLLQRMIMEIYSEALEKC